MRPRSDDRGALVLEKEAARADLVSEWTCSGLEVKEETLRGGRFTTVRAVDLPFAFNALRCTAHVDQQCLRVKADPLARGGQIHRLQEQDPPPRRGREHRRRSSCRFCAVCWSSRGHEEVSVRRRENFGDWQASAFVSQPASIFFTPIAEPRGRDGSRTVAACLKHRGVALAALEVLRRA